MKTSNFISLSLTGLAVKTYMLIGIVWSKGSEQYDNLQAVAKKALQATVVSLSHS